MARIGMLLIATMLAGGPAAPLVCELWCSTPGSAGHHQAAGCHDGSDALPGARQVAPAGSCHDDATSPPYLTETRHKESLTVVTALPLDDASPIAAGTATTTAGRRALDLRPSGPSASHLVLRI